MLHVLCTINPIYSEFIGENAHKRKLYTFIHIGHQFNCLFGKVENRIATIIDLHTSMECLFSVG